MPIYTAKCYANIRSDFYPESPKKELNDVDIKNVLSNAKFTVDSYTDYKQNGFELERVGNAAVFPSIDARSREVLDPNGNIASVKSVTYNIDAYFDARINVDDKKISREKLMSLINNKAIEKGTLIPSYKLPPRSGFGWHVSEVALNCKLKKD